MALNQDTHAGWSLQFHVPDLIEPSLAVRTEEDLNVDYPRPGSKFRKNVGIVVSELLSTAARALEKPIEPCPSIRIFAHGGFNKVFLIIFPAGVEVIARIPFPKDYSEIRMRSEIATMLFARQRLGLPAPRLFAWCLTADHPVGAPFILMERLPGVPLSENLWFNTLSPDNRKLLLGRIAESHARLVRSLPFTEVGNLFVSDMEKVQSHPDKALPDECFYVGPFVPSQKFSNDRKDVPNPTSSFPTILDHWKRASCLEFEAAHARWARKGDPYIVSEDDAGMALNNQPQTTADFADAYRNLNAILGAYHTPPEFSSLCLWHNDFAFRNILIDPDTLTITGMLDWEDVSIVPLILAARCPDETEQTNIDYRGWSFYPDEWIQFQPREDDPQHGEECMDLTWDRWYYSAQLAQQDPRFCARIWRDSEISLKLHEIVSKGWFFWLEKKQWLAETASGLVSSYAVTPDR